MQIRLCCVCVPFINSTLQITRKSPYKSIFFFFFHLSSKHKERYANFVLIFAVTLNLPPANNVPESIKILDLDSI